MKLARNKIQVNVKYYAPKNHQHFNKIPGKTSNSPNSSTISMKINIFQKETINGIKKKIFFF